MRDRWGLRDLCELRGFGSVIDSRVSGVAEGSVDCGNSTDSGVSR